MRSTIMEVDISKFKDNIKKIKKHVGNKIVMPIIKANAYGTYLNKRLDIINEFDIVGVAIVDEAIELRNIGYQKEIFILNQPSIYEIENIIKYDLIVGLSDQKFLNELLSINSKVKVHLEIETGMNRTGININDLKDFISKIKEKNNIIVEGCYTHLSSADIDFDYTNNQLKTFLKAVKIIKAHFNTIKYIHSEASNGLLNFNDTVSNTVRPGIIIYGYESCKGCRNRIDIEPMCKLKTKITFIKEVSEGTSISYSRKYITNRKTKVATIPIGYADGLRRELSNKGMVIVNNKKVPIIGNICMDSAMIDVTDIDNVNVLDDVYIFDNDLITLDDIASLCNTINYEILSTISYRVPRVFIEKTK